MNTTIELMKYIENVESSFKALQTIIKLLEKKIDYLQDQFIKHLEDHQTGDHTKWELSE